MAACGVAAIMAAKQCGAESGVAAANQQLINGMWRMAAAAASANQQRKATWRIESNVSKESGAKMA